MADLKTTPGRASVDTFITSVAADRRDDCRTLIRVMQKVTRAKPTMWGPSIVGFGTYHYKYESGREGDWFLAGFSPRARDLTLYIMGGADAYPELLAKLGPHKTGVSCLYVKRLADLDLKVLEKLVAQSVKDVRKRYR